MLLSPSRGTLPDCEHTTWDLPPWRRTTFSCIIEPPLLTWDLQGAKTDRNVAIRQPGFAHGPCWVQEELRGIGLHATENLDDGYPTRMVIQRMVDDSDAKHDADDDDDVSGGSSEGNNNGCGDDHDGISENGPSSSVTLVDLLKDCARRQDLHSGRLVYADIVKRGLLKNNVFLGSTLISMYTKCGSLEEAQEVFDELPLRNVVSWSALIAGYSQHGFGEKALVCFEQMQVQGFTPNSVTFVCALQACGSSGSLEKGHKIHAQIISQSLIESNIIVATSLLDMYAKCGVLTKAREVFEELPHRNEVTWNALISGYSQQGPCDEALKCFECMQVQGFCPSIVTFPCILKACGNLKLLDKGRCIHAQIVGDHLLEKNLVVASSLIDMYAKCGALLEAREIFDELPMQNVVLWNVLITGYVQHGHGEQALSCFEQMQLSGFPPDEITFICALKACGIVGAADKARDIHALIVRDRWLEESIAIACTLVDTYGKCGALEKAQEVFDELPVRNLVLWNALIGGYSQHRYDEEALMSYQALMLDGYSPDIATFVSILKACGSLGAAERGQKVHTEMVRQAVLERNESMILGTALVDMYANCGMLVEAQQIFDKLPALDVVAWSALMVGYAQLGNDEIVFNLFNGMLREHTQPNVVTFMIVLNACSHGGLFDEGQMYFEAISKDFCRLPNLEHYTCIIDLFGRAGHLDKVVAVLKDMPFPVNVTVWHAFLGACGKWGHAKFVTEAFKQAVQMDNTYGAAFVSLGNIYTGSSWQDDLECR